MQKNIMEQSMLFPADFLANHLALPGNKRARMMTVTSGKKCLEWSMMLNRPSLLAKMLLVSSGWHSTRCYLTWKYRVTPQKRLLYQLAVKMRGIKEIGCRLLLTPTASDGIMSKKKTENLFITENGTVRLRNKAGSSSNAGLANQVLFLPTPTTQDAKNNGSQSQQERNSLPLNAIAGGKLNPQWVEWWMGYPIGWTDLKD